MYKPVTLSFDSNISESRVRDMYKKVSVCNDKVLSQLQLPPQLIQTQFSQTDDQQYCTHIRIFS